MSTKEKIITKSIAVLERKIEATQALLNANPLSEMLQIHIDFGKLLEENQGEARFEKPFLDKLQELESRNESAKALYEKTKDSNKLTTKLVNLTSELQELKRELFYTKREQK